MMSYKSELGRHLVGILLACACTCVLVVCTEDEDSSRVVGPRDYCQFDIFNATCPDTSVILMKRARYGRMKVGRCVRGNYGFIGCAKDVLPYMDRLCSGRQNCQLDIPSLEGSDAPCPSDFKSYLEASYECVDVASGSDRECLEAHHVKLTAETGFLSSSVTEATGYGSASCPWFISISNGQHIQISFYNFQAGSGSDTPGANEGMTNLDQTGCPLYVVIKDKTKTLDLDLCNQQQRQGYFYTSTNNTLQVHFKSTSSSSHVLPKFLLQYKASGCPDIKVPKDTWVKREGESAQIRCNKTRETWYVTCRGTKWIGEIGNCTSALRRKGGSVVYNRPTPIPQGIVMAVVVGIVLGVVIGSVLLAAVFTCRRRKQQQVTRQRQDPLLTGTPGEPPKDSSSRRSSKSASNYCRFIRQQSARSIEGGLADPKFPQQTHPLIRGPNPAPEGEPHPSEGQQRTMIHVVDVEPPPYTHQPSWSSFGGPGGISAKMGLADYDRPVGPLDQERGIKDLPVYFELDAAGQRASGSITKLPSDHGTDAARIPMRDEGRYSA